MTKDKMLEKIKKDFNREFEDFNGESKGFYFILEKIIDLQIKLDNDFKIILNQLTLEVGKNQPKIKKELNNVREQKFTVND